MNYTLHPVELLKNIEDFKMDLLEQLDPLTFDSNPGYFDWILFGLIMIIFLTFLIQATIYCRKCKTKWRLRKMSKTRINGNESDPVEVPKETDRTSVVRFKAYDEILKQSKVTLPIIGEEDTLSVHGN